MDFDKILPYFENSSENEELLRQFFDSEEIKNFLSEKWDEFRKDDAPAPEIPSINPETPIDDMPFIPLIPDDEETKARYQPSFQEEKYETINRQLQNVHIQFNNGKVNQPYQMLFDFTELNIPGIEQFEFVGLEETGLRFNTSTDMIEGTPSVSGDFKIRLSCYPVGWQEGEPVFEKKITLIINPDPRALWNNIPTPEDITYYKPDSDCEYVTVKKSKGFLGISSHEKKDIVAASQRGRSHAHEGKARDDDFSILHNQESDWYVTVVADGAGSAQFSRKGSEIACTTVSDISNIHLAKYNKEIDELVKDFQKENSEIKRKKLGDALYNILGAAVFKAYKNIEQEAVENNNQIKDYATTLLAAVAKKYKFGWFVATFWVGDGGIALYNKETGFVKVMGDPDGGDFAGQTRFLTMGEVMQPAEIYKRLRFEIIEDFTALVLMTDGVTDPKFETDANLQRIEKWNNLWEDITSSVELTDDNENAAPQLLKWLDFWSPGNHDDRTIAIIY